MPNLTDNEIHVRLEALMARRKAKLNNVRYRKLETAKWNDYLVY